MAPSMSGDFCKECTIDMWMDVGGNMQVLLHAYTCPPSPPASHILLPPRYNISSVVTAITDLPAYSDTVYSDTPFTVTLLACPK